jgi:hypothetical protein
VLLQCLTDNNSHTNTTNEAVVVSSWVNKKDPGAKPEFNQPATTSIKVRGRINPRRVAHPQKEVAEATTRAGRITSDLGSLAHSLAWSNTERCPEKV